jgi:hypothetical protein
LILIKSDAEKQYINLINELVGKEEVENQTTASQSNSPEKTYKDIATSIEHETIYKIVLNRPKKLNAITVVVIRIYLYEYCLPK